MEIKSVNGMNMQANQMSMSQKVDAESKGIQNQIATAQMQLQGLSSNEELSAEEKMKKRQEIQKQITELNNQLRQHQMEMRRQQQQESQEKVEDLLGGDKERTPAKEETKVETVSTASMEAMFAADSAIQQAESYGNLSGTMEGEARVLEGEMKLDAGRGVSTEEKQKALKEAEERAAKISQIQMEILSDATVELRHVVEEEQKPEALQDKKKDGKDTILNASLNDTREKTNKYNLGKMFSSVDIHI